MSGIFYLCRGKIYAYKDEGVICLNSEAVEKYRRNIMDIHKRKEWKTSGQGAMFMGATEPQKQEQFIYGQVEAIALADEENLIYAASMDDSCGIYMRDAQEAAALDRVIARKTDMRVYHMDYQPQNKQLIASVSDGPIQRHLALCQIDNGDMTIITEGESIDILPAFSLANPRHIYFSSAGIYFDARGQTAHFSSYSLNKLNLDNGDISEIIADANRDFIKGQENTQGRLYCISRPKQQLKQGSFNPLDIALAPLRLLKAVFSWLNFFSQRYTGQGLTKRSSGPNPARQKQQTEQEIFIEGNLINAAQTLKENTRQGEKFPGIAPRSWELICLSPDGSMQVIKRGVLDFCFGKDNSIVYSNGRYIMRLKADGSEEKLLQADVATDINVN